MAGVDVGHRRAVPRVGTEPVDGLGREGHEVTIGQQTGGAGNAVFVRGQDLGHVAVFIRLCDAASGLRRIAPACILPVAACTSPAKTFWS